MRSVALALGTAAVVVAVAASTSVASPAPPVALVASSAGKVVLLTAAGDVVRTLGRGESPAFSSDGSRIAFVRDGDVYTIGTSGSGLVRVTRTAASEESPDWGPDGSLVYASNRSGQFALYVQKPGRPARQLTHPPQAWQEDRVPAWSPDGRWIAFASNRPGNFNQELYLVRPDGAVVTRLTFTPGSEAVLGDDGMPTWRPDSRSLVFVSNRDRNWELYSLDLKDRKTTRLTHTPNTSESLPRISTAGRFAFVVPLVGGSSRISIADEQLLGRRTIQAGTSVDWKPNAR